MNISNHITFAEATHTGTGIVNIPDTLQLSRMKLVAEKVFEPARAHFEMPIRVNSFFRSPKVNKAVGGANTSQHTKGEAIDISAIGFSNKHLFLYIKNSLDFDQLIYEFGTDNEPNWIHVSYKPIGNRKQVLKSVKDAKGKTYYENFI